MTTKPKKRLREKSKDYDNHYVDQFAFKEALKEYYSACEKCEAEGLDTPPIPPYIGDCVYRIAKKLGNNYNFRNYSFIQDMVSEATVHCLNKIRKFNPNLGTSAFSYFTSVVWFSFLGTIAEEKKINQAKNRAFISGDLESYALEFGDEKSIVFDQFVNSLNIGTDPIGPRVKVKLSDDEKRKKRFDAAKSPLFGEPTDDSVESLAKKIDDGDLLDDVLEDEPTGTTVATREPKVKDPCEDDEIPPSDVFVFKV